MPSAPYGIVSDIHLHNWSAFSGINEHGVNTRLQVLLDELERIASRLHTDKVPRLYMAGDLFHVRGSVMPSVQNPTLRAFERMLKHVEIRLIPGNHDLESEDSQELTNATQALAALGVVVCNEPTYFADDDVVMLPWYPKLAPLLSVMKEFGFKYEGADCIIHAPLNGVIAGIPDNGLDAKQLSKLGFRRVFVGHYHDHKAFDDVYSVGATTHQTWNDVGTKAGHLIVTDTDVSHFPTHAPSFVDYDEQLDAANLLELCAGNYVRVKMGAATEKEIKVIRDYVQNDLQAAGVVLHAMPVAHAPTRSGAVSSGATLEHSLVDFVKAESYAVDPEALTADCLEVLTESDTGRDD